MNLVFKILKMDNYHIVLPCKRTLDSDPLQKLEDYTVELPDAMNVGKGWEMALTEITFPKVWINIPTDQKIEILKYAPERKHFYQAIHFPDWVVKKGDYSLDNLVKACNDLFRDKFQEKYENGFVIKEHSSKFITSLPYLEMRETTRPLQIRCGILDKVENFFIRFDQLLGNILGFGFFAITQRANSTFREYKTIEERKPLPSYPNWHIYEGNFEDYNLNRNLENIYVTCDAIKNSYFGGDNSEVLRIVPVPSNANYGDNITQTFKHLYYYPISKDYLDKIRIRNYQGIPIESELVPFTFGTILIHLHLRRKNIIKPEINTAIKPELPVIREIKPEEPVKPDVKPEEPVKPDVKPEEPVKPDVKPEEPVEPINPNRNKVIKEQ